MPLPIISNYKTTVKRVWQKTVLISITAKFYTGLEAAIRELFSLC
jgi:hypothetical protein